MYEPFAPAVKERVASLISNIKSVIYIESRKLEYIIASKIAGGHVILADSHGVGKTSLARALAGSIEWTGNGKAGTIGSASAASNDVAMEEFSRIQCTVDLLPQDIIGYNRFLSDSRELMFNRGPIFAHFVLCDEINLLTPKTQGSFFQAMEEQSVSVEGKTYRLDNPFFIIATMNLKGVHLFPLPAPQLDRFMIQVSVGYPDAGDEASIISQHGRNDGWKSFRPVITSGELIAWQELVDRVSIHQDVIDYIVSCVRQTRTHRDVVTGASPRTGVKLSRLARALAMIRGEDFVTVDLVKEIFIPTVSHRLELQDPTKAPESVLEEILDTVPVEKSRHEPGKTRTVIR